MTEAQTAATQFCARVVGPLLLIVGAVVIARAGDMVLLIPAILQNGPLTFITGVFTLICGLTLFAAHHHWTGIAAIVISARCTRAACAGRASTSCATWVARRIWL